MKPRKHVINIISLISMKIITFNFFYLYILLMNKIQIPVVPTPINNSDLINILSNTFVRNNYF